MFQCLGLLIQFANYANDCKLFLSKAHGFTIKGTWLHMFSPLAMRVRGIWHRPNWNWLEAMQAVHQLYTLLWLNIEFQDAKRGVAQTRSNPVHKPGLHIQHKARSLRCLTCVPCSDSSQNPAAASVRRTALSVRMWWAASVRRAARALRDSACEPASQNPMLVVFGWVAKLCISIITNLIMTCSPSSKVVRCSLLA